MLEVLAPVDGADVLAAEGVVFRVRALGLEGPVRIVSDEPTPGIQGTLPFAFEGQPDEDGIVEIPLTFPLRQHVPTTWYARVGTFETPEQSWVVHTPPQVLRLDLEPEAPVTGQSLVPTVAVYDSHLSDINAGDEIFQSLRWYRNGEEMAGFVQVPGAWVQEGDTWTAEVEVRDAFEAGQTRREDVVIGNAPPTITDVRFHPAAPLAGMRVDVEVTLDDPEGDAYDVELGLRVAPRRGAEGSGPHLDWPSADAEEQPFVDAFTMPAMAVRLGNSPFSQDRAWVHVVATDARGARTDRWVEVGIGHRAPEVTAVVLQPAAPVTGDTVQV
ncbi:MAG: hypothetical protein KC656_23335, partial [Myxococcales bacterium]|nr:hypothetical protein [Myxococcales bacterium]